MAWIYLLVAGILEMGWAVGLKYTDGWTKLGPSVFTGVAMAASFYFLSAALKDLPVGTAYAVWTGIGAVGVAIIGILFLGESGNPFRVISILLIVVGIVGLRLSSGGH
jgi:quaternary ammonium compound-resistance protein SugE